MFLFKKNKSKILNESVNENESGRKLKRTRKPRKDKRSFGFNSYLLIFARRNENLSKIFYNPQLDSDASSFAL